MHMNNGQFKPVHWTTEGVQTLVYKLLGDNRQATLNQGVNHRCGQVSIALNLRKSFVRSVQQVEVMMLSQWSLILSVLRLTR